MPTPLGPKQVVSLEELLMSQVVQKGAITRLLIGKGVFTKEEFLEIVKVAGHNAINIDKGFRRDKGAKFCGKPLLFKMRKHLD